MTSQIIITDRFDEIHESLKTEFQELKFFRIDADDFLVEHAKECVEKAYLTSDKDKVIVLTANRFSAIAQNKLLKIFEEPPSKTYFILMTPLKSGILPTIRSRLPIVEKGRSQEYVPLGIDLEQLDLSQIFDFLQSNRRIDAKKAQVLVETLAKEVIKVGKFSLDDELLETFSQSVRLLDMGSPANFVLTRLVLKLLERK